MGDRHALQTDLLSSGIPLESPECSMETPKNPLGQSILMTLLLVVACTVMLLGMTRLAFI